jgi:hypothetical protein
MKDRHNVAIWVSCTGRIDDGPSLRCNSVLRAILSEGPERRENLDIALQTVGFVGCYTISNDMAVLGSDNASSRAIDLFAIILARELAGLATDMVDNLTP